MISQLLRPRWTVQYSKETKLFFRSTKVPSHHLGLVQQQGVLANTQTRPQASPSDACSVQYGAWRPVRFRSFMCVSPDAPAPATAAAAFAFIFPPPGPSSCFITFIVACIFEAC